MKTTLNVSGMHCRSCEMLISDAVGEINGAKVLSADHKNGAVIVDYDSEATLEAIRQAIRGEGFTV